MELLKIRLLFEENVTFVGHKNKYLLEYGDGLNNIQQVIVSSSRYWYQ